MTSRKRANGKARRAAKAKAKVAVAAQNQPLQGGRQMQTIDADIGVIALLNATMG